MARSATTTEKKEYKYKIATATVELPSGEHKQIKAYGKTKREAESKLKVKRAQIEQGVAVTNAKTPAMQFFREANPNVEFIYVVHHATYFSNYGPWWREGIALIQNTGVKMIDWGTLYLDIVYGQVQVPGAEHDFNRYSFIISKTASDGYHPNPLIGYLYSLMVYCAITGEKAAGQPYTFMTEGEQLEKWETYKKNSYCFDLPNTEFDERDSNFIDILSSEADIRGLQKLVDDYMSMPTKSVLKYNVRFLNDDGSLIEEKEWYYGSLVECDDPQKPGDEQGEYEFAGWDRELTRCFEDAEYTAAYQKKP